MSYKLKNYDTWKTDYPDDEYDNDDTENDLIFWDNYNKNKLEEEWNRVIILEN